MTSAPRPAPWRLRLIALLAAALLPLTACVEFTPEAGEAPRLYTVQPASAFPEGLPAIGAQLVVETPIAADGLDTQRIAVRESAQAIAYYAGARWIDTAPRMLQAALIESFRNSGKVLAVSRRDPEVRTDYSLKSELGEFTADAAAGGAAGGAPVARVRLTARLVLVAERRIVASRSFEASSTAADSSMAAVAAAFDRASQALFTDLVTWTLEGMR